MTNLPKKYEPPDLAKAPDLYETFVRSLGEKTLRNYKIALQSFARWWEQPGLREAMEALVGLTVIQANSLVLAYRNYLLKEHLGASGPGVSPSTANQHLAALKAVVKLGRLTGRCVWHLEVDSVPVQAYRDTKGPGAEAYQAMLEALEGIVDAPRETPKQQRWACRAFRDRAILRFLHDLGLRRFEVVALDMSHVDWDGARVSILGKYRRQREWWPVGKAAFEALKDWAEVRGDAPGPLFGSFHHAWTGNRLSLSSLNRIVQRVGASVGVRTTPHGFRHTAITKALDMTDGDVRTVQRFSRHRSLQTVLQYDDNRTDSPRTISDQLGEFEEEKKS
jgi:integrase/recombinase XerC